MDRFAQGLEDAQEALVVAYCAGCGGEIYVGEEVCNLEGGELLHWEGGCLLCFFRPLMFIVEDTKGIFGPVGGDLGGAGK